MQVVDSATFMTPKFVISHGVVRANMSRLGEFTPSYILHTRVFGTYLLGGLFTLQKEYKVMVFYM
jgi:hypothetical protein